MFWKMTLDAAHAHGRNAQDHDRCNATCLREARGLIRCPERPQPLCAKFADRCTGSGGDHQQHDPREQKGHHGAKAFAQEYVPAARARVGAAQFGEGHGARQGGDRADYPERKVGPRVGHDLRQGMWLEEDPYPDDAAHHQHGRVEQGQARGAGAGSFGAGGVAHCAEGSTGARKRLRSLRKGLSRKR